MFLLSLCMSYLLTFFWLRQTFYVGFPWVWFSPLSQMMGQVAHLCNPCFWRNNDREWWEEPCPMSTLHVGLAFHWYLLQARSPWYHPDLDCQLGWVDFALFFQMLVPLGTMCGNTNFFHSIFFPLNPNQICIVPFGTLFSITVFKHWCLKQKKFEIICYGSQIFLWFFLNFIRNSINCHFNC